MTHSPVTNASVHAGPVADTERLFALDAIRGAALFGVLLMNLMWIASPWLAMPEAVRDAMPTAWLDQPLNFLLTWTVQGKAQALFSMLFGLGFAIQLQRAQARGADFEVRYLRRLAVLLVFGFANLYVLWLGDILHAYAIGGLALLAMRGLSNRALVVLGLALSVLCWPALDAAALWAPKGHVARMFETWDAGVEPRFVAWTQGGYGAYLANNVYSNWHEYLGTIALPLLVGQVIGRFALGYWIARKGWLQDVAANAAGFRRVLPWLLAGGLVLCLPSKLPMVAPFEWEGVPELMVQLLDFLGQVVLAGGYAAALALWSLSEGGRRWLGGVADVGRMALTQYLLHAFVYIGVFSSAGLGWLPHMGAAAVLGVSVVFFAMQVASSRWWLARFSFGPMEWLWRWLTYGQRPPMRR